MSNEGRSERGERAVWPEKDAPWVGGYMEVADGGGTSSKADWVWKAGSGWDGGTFVLRGGGGDVINDPTIGVRYRCDESEDCGRFAWLCAYIDTGGTMSSLSPSSDTLPSESASSTGLRRCGGGAPDKSRVWSGV